MLNLPEWHSINLLMMSIHYITSWISWPSWSDTQINLTWGPFFKVGFLGKFVFNFLLKFCNLSVNKLLFQISFSWKKIKMLKSFGRIKVSKYVFKNVFTNSKFAHFYNCLTFRTIHRFISDFTPKFSSTQFSAKTK